MPRLARFIVPGVPHHIVQRGNRRQDVFFSDEDRFYYLDCLKEYSTIYEVSLLAYCLMTNHTHLVLIPENVYGLSRLMKTVHSKYAFRINKRWSWKGHLWQARFFSCPLDHDYLKHGVRYVELNPVRAEMVLEPEEYRWSSAYSHISGSDNKYLDRNNEWNNFLPEQGQWKEFLSESDEEKNQTLRRNLKRNLPAGSDNFIRQLEIVAGRNLSFRPLGRPKK